MTEHLTQATNFCQKHGVIITSQYLYHGPYFDQDNNDCAIWEVTISRPNSGHKPYVSKFGQSLANSYRAEHMYSAGELGKVPAGVNYTIVTDMFRRRAMLKTNDRVEYRTGELDLWIYRQYTPPTEYDILATLIKLDPGTLEEFCSDWGLNSDPIRDNTTYKSVHDEWHAIKKLFHDCLEELREIN